MQRQKFLPPLVAVLVALAGSMSLAQVLTIRIHHHVYGRIDDSLLPLTAAQSSRLLILGVGIVLLYLSLQLWWRRRVAWQMATAGFVVLLAAELTEVHNTAQLALYAVLLGMLIGTRDAYTVETNNYSLRRGAVVSAAIIAVVFVYATIGFATLERREVGHRLSLPASAGYAAREIFTFQDTSHLVRGRHARWFVASVDGAAVLAYTLVVFSLFRPLKFQYGPTRRETARARAIMRRYSTDTEDFFKLWPADKHYFFSATGDSFLAYKVIGSDAMVLGGPVGPASDFRHLAAAFEAQANRSGWTPTYVYADEELGKVIGERYSRLFIGNEAILDIALFAAETSRNKHFRYVRNKAERDGLEYAFWAHPLTSQQLDALQAVSGAWLSSGGRREYTYAMGYFDHAYLQGCDVAVLTRGGQAVAYANLVPVVGNTANRSIDHMRHLPGMPPTGMHYLLMQLLLQLHQSGAKGFNLGLVPLAGIETRTDTNVTERLLSVLKKVGRRYYSSEGLEQFKNKFDPEWQPRYLYYQGPPPRLVKVANNVNRALAMPARRWWQRLRVADETTAPEGEIASAEPK